MAKAASTDKNIKVRELTVPAEDAQLGRVRDFVVAACEEADFSERETSNTKLAVDEACTNIIQHAYGGTAEGEILVRIRIEPGDLKISIHDTGKRFDYAAIGDPDLDEYVEKGRKGGLGVYLINRLMDGVEYHAGEAGNELILSKRSQSAVSRGLIPAMVPFRATLRYRFMLRASSGLLLLVAAIWAFVFVRETRDIAAQRTTQWVEKRRLAENLANRSKDVLLRPDAFSVEQTSLSAYLSKLLENSDDVAYVRVVDATGQIVSSGQIDEIFTKYSDPPGAVEMGRDDRAVWKTATVQDRKLRDIDFAVRVANPDTGQLLDLGQVHLGVFEDAVEANIEDPRLTVTFILIAVFLVGLLLIMGLVSVFVKPIQVLTDGVRAIGDGSFDAKLDVGGPAEIGAIAGVFNEITNKFKKAQESVLEQEKMQKEMEVAKEIQQSLLPRKKPEVSGYDIAPLYQAAAEVGGDYYDFVDVDDDTIGVVVADVSGKGVPGSLVMTMIRTALRMEARGNKHASDVMAKMNAFVTDDMKKGMFVTMFYVILDSKNRTISYASAGHNPMILYRHETQETFFLNPKGFPVGISLPDEDLFRKSISLEKIKLKKDDMLLIYTDGVTEAMNDRREQYGESRLLSIIRKSGHLPPQDFIAALERDIRKFTGDYPQNDDITVVAVKEKFTADDVLSGIRRKLIDLVEVKGLSVKEACRQMRVSPATYYRYKKRLEVMGERGLKDKILRQDMQLKRVSLEARKEILEIIREHPEYGAKRIVDEYNEGKPEVKQITERMVYEELKRLNLNTKELRIDYLRRNRLLEEEMLEEVERRTGKEIVEDLLKEIQEAERVRNGETAAEDEEVGVEESAEEERRRRVIEFESIDEVGLNVADTEDGVTTIEVNGHLDSVTSASLEQVLKKLIADGTVKYVVDLGDVTYISSGGWGIFTGEVRHLREAGGDVVLVGMSPEVYDVYELLGFNDVLKAFATPEEAHRYFELSPQERTTVVPPPAPRYEETTPETADRSGVVERSPGDEITFEGGVPGESYVPEWESLSIEATTVGTKGDIAVVSLNGIIDTVSAERLRSALGKIVTGGIYRIVVDMSQVEYVSSGGWGTFTERLREVRRNDGDIKLFGMDPDVYYVFTMLGFNIVLSSFDILTEAIEDFETGTPPGQYADRPDEPMLESEGSAPSDRTARPRSSTGKRKKEEAPEIDLSHRDSSDVVQWEERGDGVIIAHLNGYIEAAAADAMSVGMMQELAARPPAVLFDLERVEYISSTGWGQFAKCYETVKDWGGKVALYGLSPELYEIYSCLEFNAFIAAYDNRDAAVSAVGAGRRPPQGESVKGTNSTWGAVTGDTLAGREEATDSEAPEDEVSQPYTDEEAAEVVRGDGTDFDAKEEEDEDADISVDDILEGARDDLEEKPPVAPPPPMPTSPDGPRVWPGESPPPPVEPPQEKIGPAEVPESPAPVEERPPTAPAEEERRPAPVNEDRTPQPADGDQTPQPADGDRTPQPADESRTPAHIDEVPDRQPTELDRRFIDMTGDTDGVDVDSAVSDRHLDDDDRLREIGWEAYGEKLKQRAAARRKKKEE
jgi:anti-anti-sigma factor